jgi:predicted cupin superfamily sugar epimerase
MAAPPLDELTRVLGLAPHPEGGYFRETFRSKRRVEPADGRGSRPALTTIHYLVGRGDVSRWHQVDSDEVWHFYEGAPLDLWILPPDLAALDVVRLGPLAEGARHTTVLAGWWQAARSTGDYSLVGCTVAPGFDVADFRFASDLPEVAARLRAGHPDAEGLL